MQTLANQVSFYYDYPERETLSHMSLTVLQKHLANVAWILDTVKVTKHEKVLIEKWVHPLQDLIIDEDDEADSEYEGVEEEIEEADVDDSGVEEEIQ